MLPKICQLGKYLIFFWSRENEEPIHVHVCEGTPHAEAAAQQPEISHSESLSEAPFQTGSATFQSAIAASDTDSITKALFFFSCTGTPPFVLP